MRDADPFSSVEKLILTAVEPFFTFRVSVVER